MLNHLETKSIGPIYLQPGDVLNLTYDYIENHIWCRKSIQLDKLTDPEMIDTVILYKIDNEFGLKSGRAVMLGEAK